MTHAIKFFRRLLGSTQGSTVTEFALITPVFLLVLIGIVDLGAVIRDKVELNNAASTAARYVLNENYNQSYLADVAANGSALDAADITASTETVCGCAGGVAATCGGLCDDGQSPGTYMLVSISKTSEMILPYSGLFSDMTITGESRMRLD